MSRRAANPRQLRRRRQYCVQFWDANAWNEMANTRRDHKAQVDELVKEMNNYRHGLRLRVRRVVRE